LFDPGVRHGLPKAVDRRMRIEDEDEDEDRTFKGPPKVR
jgi:hypothetical protein